MLFPFVDCLANALVLVWVSKPHPDLVLEFFPRLYVLCVREKPICGWTFQNHVYISQKFRILNFLLLCDLFQSVQEVLDCN